MKRLLAIPLVLLLSLPVRSQYADQGSGNIRNHIFWFDWAGFTMQEGASRTFTTDDGLSIQITFTNVTAHTPLPYPMNTWPGSLLWLLYNFSNPAIKPALYDVFSTQNFAYTLNITATRNGQPAPFNLVTADAEASQSGETTTLTTNGTSWQSIQFYRNSTQTDNPLTGCGTTTVAIANTYGGDVFNPSQVGQCPVIFTQAPPTGPLIVQTNSDHAGTLGGMALAFGIFDPEDRGDLPLANYGAAYHQLVYTPINSCNFNPPYPDIAQNTNLHIGLVPGDPDPIQYDNDDSIGVDEEGVSSFPVYNGNGSYSVSLTLANSTGANAWLTGWFDFNRDGTFEPGESVTAVIPNNATTATLTWTGLPLYLPQGSASGYGFRFRISSDQAATQIATGYAPDGEVEDYFVTSPGLCAPPTAATLPPQTICLGQSANLQAASGSNYSWTPSASLSNPAISNPVATPYTTTDYTVNALDPQGCADQSSVTVTVDPLPVIAIDGAAVVCTSIPAIFTATGGNNYSWTNGDGPVIATGPVLMIPPGTASLFHVTGTGSDGCIGTASILVNVQLPPTLNATASASSVCQNDSVTLTASGGTRYDWTSTSGQPLGNTPSITVKPGDNTNYQVQVSNDFCSQSQSFTIPITLKDTPAIQITSSNEITCSVGQAILHVTGGSSYQWAPVPGITQLNSPNPVVSPSSTTTYYVTATGTNGCTSTDTITQKVNYASDLSHYPVANAFTPNNDGNNDCFGLRNWPQLTALDFAVFNRWGQRVFYTTNPGACWDGTLNGTPQPAGAYVYQISASTPCGTAFRKGIVILVR